MFALSYRSTLAVSSSERAAFQVPLDYALQAGPSLDAPQDVATLARYRALAPGVGAWPVLRQSAEVAGTSSHPATPTVLGVPAAAFPLLHGWRSDFSSRSPAALGRLLMPADAGRARRRAHPARRHGGSSCRSCSPVRRSSRCSSCRRLAAAPTSCGRSSRPAAVRCCRRQSRRRTEAGRSSRCASTCRRRCSARRRTSRPRGGAATRPRSPGRCGSGSSWRSPPPGAVPVSAFRGWNGRGGITAARAGGGVRADFAIDTSENALLRPDQPFDSRLLPVIASPDIARAAGPDGELQLDFGGDVVAARLVAVARRFPTTEDAGDSFVVADEASLASALGADDLPTSVPASSGCRPRPPWRRTSAPSSRARPSRRSRSTSSRRRSRRRCAAKPLARGIVVSLIAAAVAAVGAGARRASCS